MIATWNTLNKIREGGVGSVKRKKKSINTIKSTDSDAMSKKQHI